MKQIALPGGHFAMVDDADYEELNRLKWRAKKDRNTHYALRNHSVGQAGKRIPLAMHRVVMGIADPRIFVDHIDGNGLNNQRGNLRLVTNAQNGANRHTVLSKSGFKGVTRQRRRWVARIGSNQKTFRIGSFPSPEEAARAYDKIALERYGEYAKLNFPPLRTQPTEGA